MQDKTVTFSLNNDKESDMKKILLLVYDALKEKGYNPINQIVGYILSEDPTYITTYNNARNLIRKIDRDELLQEMVKNYLGEWFFIKNILSFGVLIFDSLNVRMSLFDIF